MKKPRKQIHFILIAVIITVFTACNNSPALFKTIPSSQSGIHFNNIITENDSINPIDLEFLYNGGCVAVGDFNKDGLPDLYFTAQFYIGNSYLSQSSSFIIIDRGISSVEIINKSGEKRIVQ